MRGEWRPGQIITTGGEDIDLPFDFEGSTPKPDVTNPKDVILEEKPINSAWKKACLLFFKIFLIIAVISGFITYEILSNKTKDTELPLNDTTDIEIFQNDTIEAEIPVAQDPIKAFTATPPNMDNVRAEDMTKFIRDELNPWYVWATTSDDGPCKGLGSSKVPLHGILDDGISILDWFGHVDENGAACGIG